MENFIAFFKNTLSNLESATKLKVCLLFILLLCAIYYSIKNYKIINYQSKILMPFLMLTFSGLIYFAVAEDIKFKLLLKSFELTTGKIKSYFISRNKGHKGQSTNKIAYFYNCNGRIFQNSYYENIHVNLPDDRPNLDLNYLVIYQKSNPKNSFILLNYPCSQIDDLLNYQKIFNTELPSNVFNND